MSFLKLHGLEVTTTIGCRLNCSYCPQQKLIREYKRRTDGTVMLSLESFRKCLEKVEIGSTINFCGMSEPFHNPECADMIVYANQKGYKIGLNTTLVGMTKEDFNKIKDIKFDHFILHIPDKENNSKFNISENYLELLKLVEKFIPVNYYSCHGTVHPLIEAYICRGKFSGIHVSDRAGNLEIEGSCKDLKTGPIVCGSGSEENVGVWAPVLFPDGSLVLCCNDYGMEHILGNLFLQDWEEILNGNEMLKVVKGQRDESIPILCRKCVCARPLATLPAYKLKKILSEYCYKDNNIPDFIDEKDKDILNKVCSAKYICVYGLGKLFKEHFFADYWHECLGTVLLSDSNKKLWGENIHHIKCVSPDDLKKYNDLLIIIHTLNFEPIKKELKKMGFDNCISIFDIYRIAGQKVKITNGNVLFLRS